MLQKRLIRKRKLGKKRSKKIVSITTKVCTGRRIQKENLQAAIRDNSKNITLEIKDFGDMSKGEITKWRNKRVFLKDFPTTVFINNDVITFHTVGSLPKIVNIRYIDLYLK